MTRIHEIAKVTDLSDEKSTRLAAAKMRAVSDHELHFYLVMRDTLNETSSATRQGITLAQVESDRRDKSEKRRLAFFTTLVSGLLALMGVALGAYLAKPTQPTNDNLSSTTACSSQQLSPNERCASSKQPIAQQK